MFISDKLHIYTINFIHIQYHLSNNIFLIFYLLLQISIIVLLARPQQIHVVPQANYLSSMNVGPAEEAKTMLLLDKQISHLKEEMLMVETLLEKMQLQHALLKAQLQDVLRDRMNR